MELRSGPWIQPQIHQAPVRGEVGVWSNKTLRPQSLVNLYLRDLDFEVEKDEGDGSSKGGDVASTTREDNRMGLSDSQVDSSKEIGAVDSQELDLLAS